MKHIEQEFGPLRSTRASHGQNEGQTERWNRKMRDMIRITVALLVVLSLAGCSQRGPKYSAGDTVSLTGKSTDTGPEMTANGTVAEVLSDESTGKTIHFYRVDLGALTAGKEELPLIREKFLKKANE